jgi:hypothetical protein
VKPREARRNPGADRENLGSIFISGETPPNTAARFETLREGSKPGRLLLGTAARFWVLWGVAVVGCGPLNAGRPIKNHRLVASDEASVTFRYGDHQGLAAQGSPTEKVMKLPVSEFLNRLLLHVPVPGFHVTRGYGLYSRTGRRDLETCRSRLTRAPGTASPTLAARPEKGKRREPRRCPFVSGS